MLKLLQIFFPFMSEVMQVRQCQFFPRDMLPHTDSLKRLCPSKAAATYFCEAWRAVLVRVPKCNFVQDHAREG
jgi:hypothetical protein